jgi:succinate dehydrogenase/fumarate reductase flavoprotein subunit
VADLVVAGAGMAGLAAAAEARAHGARVRLLEKGDRPGGSMLLSSGVLWRHRRFEDFRAECPGGDPVRQRQVWEELDEGLDWLESLGARVTVRETGNPRTTGRRFDTASLTESLAAAAGGVETGTPLTELPDAPVILATGGFAASRERVREWITPEADALTLRCNPWSTGDGLALGLGAGGTTSPGMDEFYGRAMPDAPVTPDRFVGLAQLYARHAEIEAAGGERFTTRTWSEIDAVQWIARRPGARATYAVPREKLGERVRELSVQDMIERAEAAGAAVRWAPDVVRVPVVAGITTTLGGLQVDDGWRVAGGVWAVGADAGGISTGGYASGLAAGLVAGRRAARAALGAGP